MRPRWAAIFAAGALAFATLGTPFSAGASAGKLATAIVKVGPKDGGGEPSIAQGPGGILYTSWPGDHMNLTRSTDGGRTWTPGTQPKEVESVGDTSVDTDSAGAVYETNLNVVVTGNPTNSLQVSLYKSMNKGKTWSKAGESALNPSNSTGQPLFVDRQWVDAWIPPGKTTKQATVALMYHDFGPSQIWVSTSTDGGKTFGVPVDAISSPEAEAASACSTIPGGLRIAPQGPHRGRIYVAWLAADPLNAATGCNLTQLQAFHSVWAAWSDDGGATWTDKLVYDAGPLHDGSEIFADLALDNKANPYVAYPMNLKNEFDIYVSASFDQGATFKGPFKVNTTKGTHYFPAIDAGRPGQVDVAYLATPTVVPTAPYGKPQPGGDADAVWYVYMAQTLNLMGGKFTEIKITPKSIHKGDVCTLGIFCSAVPNSDRSLLDFIDIVGTPDGMAHVVWTVSNGQMKDGVYGANQTSGPSIGPSGH
jgi:hypothetical protein